MFEHIDAVDIAVQAAKNQVLSHRRQFIPFLSAAEIYAAKEDNEIVISGDGATRLLLNQKVEYDNYQYEFYAANAVKAARELADLLYAQDPEFGRYISMITQIPNNKFVIKIDECDIIIIRALPIHRGVKTFKLLVPSERSSSFVHSLKIKCMGPEIQLIGIYAALSNPALAKNWITLQKTERVLRDLFMKEIGFKIDEISDEKEGGGTSNDILQLLTMEYLSDLNRVLIGTQAATLLGWHDPRENRLQVVTTYKLCDEDIVLKRILNKLNYNVQTTINEPRVPTDTRLRRLTGYIIRPDKRREPFIDIYNTASYELVPAPIIKSIRIGTLYVQARFLLIDFWTLQLLLRMQAIDANYTEHVLRMLVRSYKILCKQIDKTQQKDLFPFLSQNYIGQYEDSELAIKRETYGQQKERRIFYPIYFPAVKCINKSG
jgi:hypothetical protein